MKTLNISNSISSNNSFTTIMIIQSIAISIALFAVMYVLESALDSKSVSSFIKGFAAPLYFITSFAFIVAVMAPLFFAALPIILPSRKPSNASTSVSIMIAIALAVYAVAAFAMIPEIDFESKNTSFFLLTAVATVFLPASAIISAIYAAANINKAFSN